MTIESLVGKYVQVQDVIQRHNGTLASVTDKYLVLTNHGHQPIYLFFTGILKIQGI